MTEYIPPTAARQLGAAIGRGGRTSVSDLGGDFKEDVIEDVSHAGGGGHCGGGEGGIVEEGGGETGSREGHVCSLLPSKEVGRSRGRVLQPQNRPSVCQDASNPISTMRIFASLRFPGMRMSKDRRCAQRRHHGIQWGTESMTNMTKD
jgi:hypothetical protein